MDKKNLAIGVFDSGIGGLTVAKEIIDLNPGESIIYIGDTARVPYGTRGSEIISKFASELLKFLEGKQVKLLVVACNTISAVALKELEKIAGVPIINVIDPAVDQALKMSQTKKIAVIGTNATISSNVYKDKILEKNPEAKIFQKACPLFVPIVEEGMAESQVALETAHIYLDELKEKDIDTLILGCTHYHLLSKVITEVLGSHVNLISSAHPTAIEVSSFLDQNDLNSDNLNPEYKLYVTDAPARVSEVAARFIQNGISRSLEKITLE